MDLNQYDKILVSFSGGKDSLGCLLHLIDIGVDLRKVELWHQCVDGRDPDTHFMDWPCTEDYCRNLGRHFNIPVFYQWKVGGFWREMHRLNQRTAPIAFELENGEIMQVGGTRGKQSTRGLFPQVSADLKVRWCSAYLKIDVMATALRNQARFDGAKTLVITGERAEESPARSRYQIFEPDRADNRSGSKARLVDHFRPVHAFPEARIWETMERYKVDPHPAYKMGWGRLSCMTCIFGSEDQWASIKMVDPERADTMIHEEIKSGKTIKRDRSIMDQISAGSAFIGISQKLVSMAMSRSYTAPIHTDNWQLPAGAFGDSAGPS